MRLWNNDVFSNPDGAVESILDQALNLKRAAKINYDEIPSP